MITDFIWHDVNIPCKGIDYWLRISFDSCGKQVCLAKITDRPYRTFMLIIMVVRAYVKRLIAATLGRRMTGTEFKIDIDIWETFFSKNVRQNSVLFLCKFGRELQVEYSDDEVVFSVYEPSRGTIRTNTRGYFSRLWDALRDQNSFLFNLFISRAIWNQVFTYNFAEDEE